MRTEKRFSVKATVIGFITYFLCVVTMVTTGAIAGALATSNSASLPQIVEEISGLLLSTRFAILCLGVGAPFATAGGFLATRLAGRGALKYALPVGFLLLFAGILLVSLMPLQTQWLLPAALLFPLPLVLAGGRLAGVSADSFDVREAKPERWNHPATAGATPPPPTVSQKPSAHENGSRKQAASETVSSSMGTELVGQLVKQRLQSESEQQQEAVEEAKRRALNQALDQAKAEACEGMRDVVRAAFLTHPAATEADFERCWPALRDEMFKQHALRSFNAQRTQKS